MAYVIFTGCHVSSQSSCISYKTKQAEKGQKNTVLWDCIFLLFISSCNESVKVLCTIYVDKWHYDEKNNNICTPSVTLIIKFILEFHSLNTVT